jgi:hypothetical protein
MATVLLFIALALPVLILVALIRIMTTIVNGLRSINATNLRIANAVELLAREQQSREGG